MLSLVPKAFFLVVENCEPSISEHEII